VSKSLKRVCAALSEAGLDADILEMHNETRTAAQAAIAADCHIDQIAKSIIFGVEGRNEAVLFITAGGNQVDHAKANAVSDETLGKATAALIRAQTGFAIGGVAPVGHLNPIRAFIDPRLLEFGQIWAAAGTPRHIFSISPNALKEISSAQIYDFTS